MATIIVTGAAGFIGYHVANALSLDPANDVVCVDNFSRGSRDKLYLELTGKRNVTHVDVDLTDLRTFEKLPGKADFIYHMAALNGTQNFYENPFLVLKSSTIPTLNLIEHYGKSGRHVGRFVYAGSSEAYAATITRFNWEIPTGEDVPLSLDDIYNPRWSYAASKMHGEVATIHGCRQFGIDFTIIRYHNTYGPRMGDKHVIPDFLTRARKGVFELYGFDDTRSFIYVDDSVRATVALANAADAVDQVVNVGGPEEIRIEALARLMMEVCGFKGDLVLHPSPKGSVSRRAPKLDKLINLIKFRHTVDLREGVRRTADFYLRD